MRKIAFHNVNGNKAFEVEDQGTIRIDQREYVVKYVDEEHFIVNFQ